MNQDSSALFNRNDEIFLPLRSTCADVRIIQSGVERHVTGPIRPANARLSTAHKFSINSSPATAEAVVATSEVSIQPLAKVREI